MSRAKFVNTITVIDPDTDGEVQITVYKHQNGGMFAIDSSYIEQGLDDDGLIYDPFADMGDPQSLYLEE